jgi:hypothetical protein
MQRRPGSETKNTLKTKDDREERGSKKIDVVEENNRFVL